MKHNMAGNPNISDDALRQAARAVRDAMLAALPAPNQCAHTFSPEFQTKMHALLARERSARLRRRRLRRAAIVFLVLVLGSGLWLSAGTDAMAAVKNWVHEVYENSIVYRFFHKEAEPLPDYRLNVGNDYELVYETKDASMYNAYYLNSHTGQHIFFVYRPMSEENLVEYMGNKNIYEYEEVSIGGVSADFYQSTEADGTNNLIWIDEEARLVFSLDSNLPKSDMIALAESLQKTP